MQKTTTQLIDEMEDYFFHQDVNFTSIEQKPQKNTILIEFRTYGEMFDTINHALYEMINLYDVDYGMLEERLGKNSEYGWDFSETFLPYIKQIIYKAIDAHDLRVPEDLPIHRRNIQQQVQLEYDFYVLSKCSGALPQKVHQKITRPFQKFVKRILG